MLVITLGSTILGVVQTIVTNRLGQDVLRELRDRLYRHLQELSLSFYAGTRTGDLQSRITSDVGGIQTAVTTTISNMLSNTVTFISALTAMLLLSWQLTLLSLAHSLDEPAWPFMLMGSFAFMNFMTQPIENKLLAVYSPARRRATAKSCTGTRRNLRSKKSL